MHAPERRPIEDHGPAQGAVHPGVVLARYGILEHLVPGEDPLGIGPRVAVERDAEDDIVVIQIVGLCGGDHLRMVEGWNAVPNDTSPPDLVEPDVRRRVFVEVVLEAGVDRGIQFRLERGVVRMRAGVGTPDPLPPCVEIAPQPLSRPALEYREDASPILFVRRVPNQLDKDRRMGVVPVFHDQLFRGGHHQAVPGDEGPESLEGGRDDVTGGGRVQPVDKSARAGGTLPTGCQERRTGQQQDECAHGLPPVRRAAGSGLP